MNRTKTKQSEQKQNLFRTLPNRINVKLIKYDNRLKHETPKLEIHKFEIIQPSPILVKYRTLNSQIQLQK